MKWEKPKISFGNSLDTMIFPPFYQVQQLFDRDELRDPALETKKQLLAKMGSYDLEGKTIGITAGSRGICGQIEVLQALIQFLKEKKANPVIIAAMGSHGGATEKGQRALLASLGIDEGRLGVPIVSCMDTRLLAKTPEGVPIHFDAAAAQMDGVIVVNKIKPHADFKADIESGLAKMMAIGLGKHQGAVALHKQGFDCFSTLLPEVTQIILENAPILAGIALIENAYDRLQRVEVISPANILDRERELLKIAKANIASIPVNHIDVLVIREIGKNISGEGMDPNVTGRPGSYLNNGFENIQIRNIVVLDVTPHSHGNAAGIGMADITTSRLFEKIDFGAMYTNSITASILGPSRLPMVLENDKQALQVAMRICPRKEPQDLRIVIIKNTLELDEVIVSKACIPDLERRSNINIDQDIFSLVFDNQGFLRT